MHQCELTGRLRFGRVHEDYELRHWTKKFGVSADQLKAAVTAVGPTVKAVEAHLKGAGHR
jgi:hypothetical protein